MPFLRLDDDRPAEIVLAQVSDRTFRLVEGFRYVDGRTFTVRPDDLQSTDLASVPWFFRWFVSSSGRHTPAALLHDYLVRSGDTLDPPVDRAEADDVFLEALADLRVPFVRRRVMWTAVVAATRWTKPWLFARLGILLWVVAAVAGLATFLVAAASLNWILLAVAALAPIPFALLWGRRAAAGVIAGLGVLMVWLPVISILLSYSGYWIAEKFFSFRARPATRGGPAEEPPSITEL